MIGRWLATALIAGLFALNLLLPDTSIGRRGTEMRVRSDAPAAVARVGERLPPLLFEDLGGAPVRLADFRGHPVLLVFERSVDW